MPIYLHDKYDKKIQEAFVRESVIKGLLSDEYDFTGVKTVKISTLQTVPMNDYQRKGTNRYGEPKEMEDTVQELTLTQDKGFAITIDKGNNADQNGIKAAGRALALQVREQCVPLMDRYVLGRLANMAGTIAGSATAISKENVVERIASGTVVLDDAEVPEANRALLVSASVYKFLRLSPEFIGAEKLAVKSLVKGQVGEFDSMRVIKVPKGRWPKGANFMIVYKKSGCAPVKLDDTKIHKDPPGLSGNLLEGRQYYDAFVFGTKAMGIYVDVDTNTAAVTALPVIGLTGASASITAADGVKFFYTTDGTDPRYSVSAKEYSTSVTLESGQTMKAYGRKDGEFPSGVSEKTYTA